MALYVTRTRRNEVQIGRGVPSCTFDGCFPSSAGKSREVAIVISFHTKITSYKDQFVYKRRTRTKTEGSNHSWTMCTSLYIVLTFKVIL